MNREDACIGMFVTRPDKPRWGTGVIIDIRKPGQQAPMPGSKSWEVFIKWENKGNTWEVFSDLEILENT